MQAIDSSRRNPLGRAWRIIYASGLLVPLVFVLVALCFAPIGDRHELDYDEGIELMKGVLVSEGHDLYTEIWNEEPPVFTLLLAQWVNWFGTSLAASRLLVLLFSALLLWAFYQTVRLAVSEAAALSSVALLLLSSFYVQLSISVMIGLPAIALAMLSLYLLVVGQPSGRMWLAVVSGVLSGLSVQTKLFTVILVPVILIYLWFLNEPGTRRGSALALRLGRCALWLGAVGVAFVVAGVLVGTLDPHQLITPHLGAQARAAYRSFGDQARVAQMLRAHAGYLLLAAMGIVWGLKRRIPTVSLALGWFVLALASVLYQEPLWYHHFLLVTVPLAWLCAFGVEAGFRAFGLRDAPREMAGSVGPRRAVRLLCALCIGGLVVFNLAWRGRELPNDLGFLPQSDRIINQLCPDGSSKPGWVFTDRPIYALEAGLVVPPPVAVTSRKRLITGELTEDMLLDIIRTYRPEYVVLERYVPDLTQKFMEALSDDYGLLEEYYDHTGLVALLFGPQPVSAGRHPATDQERSKVLFDDWLLLEWSPALIGDRVEAGNCVGTPGLSWQRPAAHAGRDLGISLRLVDPTGNILAQHDEPLGSDFNTLHDRAQIPYFLNVLIPDGTPPGNYDLRLVVYDPQTGLPLQAAGAAANESGVVLKQVRVDRTAGTVALRPPMADFGPVRLISADTPARAVSPGGEVPLDLLWQADADHDGESLVVVAQLLDDQGRVVAGLEEEPLNGSYGASGWQAGELVRDNHTLSVPADAPPGRYDLIVGLYRLPTRERLRTPAGLLGLRSRDYFLLRQIDVR